MWSIEHDGQTDSYWEWLATLRGLKGGILLSPVGVLPQCPQFSAMSYLELLSCLLEGAVERQLAPQEESVLAGYVKTLAVRVLRAEIRVIQQGDVDGSAE